MNEGLRAGLLLFALLTSLSAVPVLLRRLRPTTLAALHALGLVVALALVLSAALSLGDARPLLLPYLVAIGLTAVAASGPGGAQPIRGGLARASRRPGPRALSWCGLALGALGVLSSSLTALGPRLPFLALLALAVLSSAFGAAASWTCFARARACESDAQRRSEASAGAAVAIASIAVFAALVVGEAGAGLWPVLLGVAASLLTAARMPPFAPPTGREGVSALFIGLAILFAATRRGSFEDALLIGAEAALVGLAVLAASRPLLVARASSRLPVGRPTSWPSSGALVTEAALAHMSPMLDDGLLFRPARPRVNARVTAKRLLEAALERARAAQPAGPKAQLAVEVREDGADADVEGDPGELAEALCAVLDNALCLKHEHPGLYVRVHVRGSPGHVTFEVTDDLAEHAREDNSAGVDEARGPVASLPFSSAREGDRPGLGVGLARAKLLIEKHGGVLLARRTSEGSCVQLTLPRRRSRSPFGIA